MKSDEESGICILLVSLVGLTRPRPPSRCTALDNPSALFRHDVCFCLGQRQETASIEVLSVTLRDREEHPM